MPSFEVFIYYSTFSTQTVEADNEDEAIIIARKRVPDYDELLPNLEPWEEADTAEED